jgi:hypothetical protein
MQRSIMIRETKLPAADGMIPAYRGESMQALIRRCTRQQTTETLKLFGGQLECRTVFMLTLERPEGMNVNPVRLIQPEQNPARFYSTPWITPETAHGEFGQLFQDQSQTMEYG